MQGQQRFFWMGALAVLILIMAACTGANKLDLDGTSWQLQSMGIEMPLAGNPVTLIFDEGGNSAGGNASCNQYSGSFRAKGGKVTFGEIASTMMYCMDEGVMEQETRYLQLLASAHTAHVEGDGLLLETGDGIVMRFARLR